MTLRSALWPAVAVLCAAPGADAVCGGPADPGCLPRDPLSTSFAQTVSAEGCHHTYRVDEAGRVVDPPPGAGALFAQQHGDEAIPFLDTVASRCREHGRGYRIAALAALAALGTPRAIEALRSHARPGLPDRDEACWQLLKTPWTQPGEVAELLRGEQEKSIRLLFSDWLYRRGDSTTVAAVREALAAERDPEVATSLRRALVQMENPKACVLYMSLWSWSGWGHECVYTCRGIDRETLEDAWLAVLPCSDTLSRGWHPQSPRVKPLWAVPVLLLLAADLLLRRGLFEGLALRRIRLRRRTATGAEAVYIGLAFCFVSLVPLGAALAIWLSTRH
jgi:hypothetical protein